MALEFNSEHFNFNFKITVNLFCFCFVQVFEHFFPSRLILLFKYSKRLCETQCPKNLELFPQNNSFFLFWEIWSYFCHLNYVYLLLKNIKMKNMHRILKTNFMNLWKKIAGAFENGSFFSLIVDLSLVCRANYHFIAKIYLNVWWSTNFILKEWKINK